MIAKKRMQRWMRMLRKTWISRVGFVCSTGLLLACLASRPALALDIVLMEAAPGDTLTPTYDANLNKMGDIMQAAANYWESIILDNHQITVTYGYADLDPGQHGLSFVTANDGQRATVGGVAFDIETNSPGDWFFDATPTDHSEFSMHQVLHRDLPPQAQGLYYNGNPNDVLEVGYWGNYTGPDQGAMRSRQLFTRWDTSSDCSTACRDSAHRRLATAILILIHYSLRAIRQPSSITVLHPRNATISCASDATMAVGAGFGDRNLPSTRTCSRLPPSVVGRILTSPAKIFGGMVLRTGTAPPTGPGIGSRTSGIKSRFGTNPMCH